MGSGASSCSDDGSAREGENGVRKGKRESLVRKKNLLSSKVFGNDRSPVDLLRDLIEAEEIPSMVDYFDSLDSNDDGIVRRDELWKALAVIGYPVSKRESDALFKVLDIDNSGGLDVREVIATVKWGKGLIHKANERASAKKLARVSAHAPAAASPTSASGDRRSQPPVVTNTRDEVAARRQAIERYTNPGELLAVLDSKDVALISFKWLRSFAKSGQKMPRRQDLPSDAFLPPARLKQIHRSCRNAGGQGAAKVQAAKVRRLVLPIVSVSYAWLTPGDPDPDGKQLRAIASALNSEFFSHKMEACFDDIGVFWDWASLYQNPRSDGEYAAFRRALTNSMDLWYAHSQTSVLYMTELPEGTPFGVQKYANRGWPTYECCSSQLIKRKRAFGGSGWEMCVDFSARGGRASHRDVPYCPAAFRELLKTKKFTNGSDEEMVADLYTRESEAVLAASTELVFDHIEVRGEGARLGSVLRMCIHVERLSLKIMGFTDAELAAMAAELGRDTLPCLVSLSLQDNQIGDDGLDSLAAALRRGAMPALRKLTLSRNPKITAAGRATLGAAAPSYLQVEF